MKVLVAIGLLGASATSLLAQSPLTLWYRQPAKLWVEALPVGNGKLGAMIFGGTASEQIQFNEQTVWTGAPHDYAHKGAYQYLDKIRELLWAGQQKEAEALALKEFMSEPLRQKAYQAFGDLLLDFPGIDESGVTDYRRALDLNTAIAAVEFQAKGVTYRREIFASYPAKVIVIRLTANRPGSVTFSAALKSAHRDSTSGVLGDGDLVMDGQVEGGAIRFEARLDVAVQGGKRETRDGRAVVEGADSATLVLTGATNFVDYKDVSGDPKARNARYLVGVHIKSYDTLRAEHIADYRNLFGRVALDLGTSPAAANPTDERVRDFAGGHDPQLVALVFQYGRYLLISSSRPGGQPANLQGLWNQSNTPPWESKYTTNINTEMNYWPAEETNLAECEAPLFAAMKDLQASGAITAKEEYNARGWVLHHNFDLWRGTAPINAPHDGLWPSGGAWLATGLWEHYLFSGDRQFLRDAGYPLMKGAALFFVDTLVKDPKSGYLITGPSNSPEQGGLVMGPTMDREIVRALFGDVIAASRILNVDDELRARLTEMRGRIAPYRIGRYHQLQEWMEDVDDPTNHHRHVSHLWAVYPGSEITRYGTPDLFAAARQSLIYRGDEATGWSLAWKINLWARFLDGEHAYRILRNLVTPAADKGPGVAAHAGLYANLFDAHPPFQIDGNFGATAGITEMLLQSDDPHGTPTSLTPAETGAAAFLTLLPALPGAFPTGNVSGLRARGDVGVALEWRDGKLEKATLRPGASKPITLRYDGRQATFDAQAGKTYEVGPDLKVRP
ncbi:MAG: glycosyl hydrolase family 95 catalytic domain-containing protein [Bryobacteraceae bacterium]